MYFVRQAFESNYIAPVGPLVDAFEREFAKQTGLPHAVALSSGTAAMHLALRVLGVGPGDEVLAPSLTFIGGVSPAMFLGARLGFVDSDRASWNMDPDLLEEALGRREQGGRLPRVVISVDIYGQSADLHRIGAICKRRGVAHVSDSAESLGATYRGRGAGCGARAAIFSLNGNKIITVSGGGVLASGDRALVEEARFLSQQARENVPHYEHRTLGYNYRLSNILAGIGLGQLEVLEERVRSRRRVFNSYRTALAGVPGIEFMPEASYGVSNRWLTVILVTPALFGASREEVRLALERENIESRPIWKPMHLQPVFNGCEMQGGSVCEDLFARGLCLPSGTAMTQEDLDRVVAVIKGVYNSKVAGR